MLFNFSMSVVDSDSNCQAKALNQAFSSFPKVTKHTKQALNSSNKLFLQFQGFLPKSIGNTGSQDNIALLIVANIFIFPDQLMFFRSVATFIRCILVGGLKYIGTIIQLVDGDGRQHRHCNIFHTKKTQRAYCITIFLYLLNVIRIGILHMDMM